jgi:hypothetical protein
MNKYSRQFIMMPHPSTVFPSSDSQRLKDHLSERRSNNLCDSRIAFISLVHPKHSWGRSLVSKIMIMGVMPVVFSCRTFKEDLVGHAKAAGSWSLIECTVPWTASTPLYISHAGVPCWVVRTQEMYLSARSLLQYVHITPKTANMMDNLNKEPIAIGRGIQAQKIRCRDCT